MASNGISWKGVATAAATVGILSIAAPEAIAARIAWGAARSAGGIIGYHAGANVHAPKPQPQPLPPKQWWPGGPNI